LREDVETVATVTPFLWFDNEAEEAARLYTSIFPKSQITKIVKKPDNVPGPSAVLVVSFVVAGQHITAMNGGPGHPHTDAFSLSVEVDTQAEVDRVWAELVKGGGAEIQCGWLRDRFGVHWQVFPSLLPRLLGDADPAKSAAVAAAMMKMVKLDADKLQAAYDAA
jgi:predicted 3-demethylubiquinone-9 3-methyltransferase (glyoxalase superfamily)